MWDISSQSTVESELSDNEKLIWSGRPRQGIVFRSSDIFMVPFSLLWGGFAIFWEATAIWMIFKSLNSDKVLPFPALIFPLFGLPFVIIGLYLIFGRFIHDSKRREKTFYGVSDQRIIIVSGIFSRNVKSLNLKTMTDISLTEKSDRSGTITFGRNNPFSWWYGGMPWPGTPKAAPSFEMIQSAKEVYEKIRKAQEKEWNP